MIFGSNYLDREVTLLNYRSQPPHYLFQSTLTSPGNHSLCYKTTKSEIDGNNPQRKVGIWSDEDFEKRPLIFLELSMAHVCQDRATIRQGARDRVSLSSSSC